MNLTGGPSGKNAGFTCGATGALGNPGTIPVIQQKGLTLHPLGRLSSIRLKEGSYLGKAPAWEWY